MLLRNLRLINAHTHLKPHHHAAVPGGRRGQPHPYQALLTAKRADLLVQDGAFVGQPG